MTSGLVLKCPCGRRLRVKNPSPGMKGRCPACGKEHRIEKPKTASPQVLQCSQCAGHLEIAYVSEGKDKVGICRSCGTWVDLPDIHGTTRRRVIRRPGEEVIETVTRWTTDGGAVPDLASLPNNLQAVPGPVHRIYSLDGKEFDSWEKFESHVRGELPVSLADSLLERIRGIRKDRPLRQRPRDMHDLPPSQCNVQ